MTAEPLPAATCAYAECQAGGVILAGAPRHKRRQVWITPHSGFIVGPMHPGCRSAYERNERTTTNGATR